MYGRIYEEGNGAPLGRQRSWHLGHDPCDDGLRRRAGERGLSGEQLVEDSTECVDVCAWRDQPLAHRLLRAHVLGRSEREPCLCEARAAGVLYGERDAEVRHQRLPIVAQKYVLRFDVPVHDAVAMRVVECTRDLPGDAERVSHRELPLALEPASQRLAFDVGHDVVWTAPKLARSVAKHPRVDQSQTVRMLQVSGDADLCQEALAANHRGQIRMQDFDGDRAVVLPVVREIDHGHSASSELALQCVRRVGHRLGGR